VHVIQLALGALLISARVKGCTKSWEAHQRNQQFGQNQSTHIGKSQTLRKEGNARIIKMSVMKPGLAKIIEKGCISTIIERTQTDHFSAAYACRNDYADTGSSK